MQQYKLRWLVKSGSKLKYGFTIPTDIVNRFGVGTLFTLSISGTNIMFSSGTTLIPTPEQVTEFNFESIKATI